MDQLELDFGVCQYSGYDADGFLEYGIDHPGAERGKGAAAPARGMMPWGTWGRPLDPDTATDPNPTMGCEMMWGREGDSHFAMPTIDPRLMPFLPKAKKGGFGIFGAVTEASGALVGASYALFDGQDPNKQKRGGSFTLASKYGDKAHVFALNVRTSGKEEISLFHGEGHGLAIDPEGGATLRNKDGSAWMGVNDEGAVVAGPLKIQGGLVVGEAAAAIEAANAKVLALALTALAAAGGPAAPAMQAALQPFLLQLGLRNLKASP